MTAVECSLDGGPFTADGVQMMTSGFERWSVKIQLPPSVPAAGRDHGLQFRCRDAAGLTSEPVLAAFRALDTKAPRVTIDIPMNGAAFAGDRTGATAPFAGKVDDTYSGQFLSSGIARVECRVTPEAGGAAVVKEAEIAPDGKWSAPVRLPGPGSYIAVVRAMDAGGIVVDEPVGTKSPRRSAFAAAATPYRKGRISTICWSSQPTASDKVSVSHGSP